MATIKLTPVVFCSLFVQLAKFQYTYCVLGGLVLVNANKESLQALGFALDF
jgi:hypothetical protein